MYGIIKDSEIEINSVKIRIKEYMGMPVVTFADVDAVHGRPAGTAKRNFNKNKERFIEGEDFFVLALTEYEIRTQFGAGKKAGRTLTLLTESGYLMLVKSFTDELSWKVQRQLVKTYFRVSQTATSDKDLLLQIIENQMTLERKIDALEKKSDNILKTLFDISSNVIANGLEALYNKFLK